MIWRAFFYLRWLRLQDEVRGKSKYVIRRICERNASKIRALPIWSDIENFHTDGKFLEDRMDIKRLTEYAKAAG